MRCIRRSACFEMRPGGAASLLSMRMLLMALRKMPHPEVPRGARLEGRTTFSSPMGFLPSLDAQPTLQDNSGL
jgi:hypothetical protein